MILAQCSGPDYKSGRGAHASQRPRALMSWSSGTTFLSCVFSVTPCTLVSFLRFCSLTAGSPTLSSHLLFSACPSPSPKYTHFHCVSPPLIVTFLAFALLLFKSLPPSLCVFLSIFLPHSTFLVAGSSCSTSVAITT